MNTWADEFQFSHLSEDVNGPKDSGSNGDMVITAVGGRVFRRVQFKPFTKEGAKQTQAIVAELNGVHVYFFEGGKRVIMTTEKLL